MRRTDPISFRIKAGIKQDLERLAKEDRRSLSSYIELVLEGHIEGRKEPQGATPAEGGPGVRLRSMKGAGLREASPDGEQAESHPDDSLG